VHSLEIIYSEPVKILSKYSKNASVAGAFFVFSGQKLFRTKKNNHRSKNFLINNEQLIGK